MFKNNKSVIFDLVMYKISKFESVRWHNRTHVMSRYWRLMKSLSMASVILLNLLLLRERCVSLRLFSSLLSAQSVRPF